MTSTKKTNQKVNKGLQERMQDLYFELLPAKGGDKDKAEGPRAKA